MKYYKGIKYSRFDEENFIEHSFIQDGNTCTSVKNAKWHRYVKPAYYDYLDNKIYKEYWLNDIYYLDIKTDEEWIRYQKLLVFL